MSMPGVEPLLSTFFEKVINVPLSMFTTLSCLVLDPYNFIFLAMDFWQEVLKPLWKFHTLGGDEYIRVEWENKETV